MFRTMGTRDKRVDAYIKKSADFARPILCRLRETVHEGCPEVEETIKWGFPFFLYHGMLCYMASFKQHCAFGFWRGRLVVDKADSSYEAMGQFGRVTSMKDVPPKRVLLKCIKDAMRLKQEVAKPAARSKPRLQKELNIPPYFTAALKKNRKALATFEGFSYSKRKDYVEWVAEARTDETRERRLETSIEWLAEGKSRNWKYEKC